MDQNEAGSLRTPRAEFAKVSGRKEEANAKAAEAQVYLLHTDGERVLSRWK